MRSCDLLLIGGGHANLAVLADWIRCGAPPGAQAVMVTPHASLVYSGMVPGWISGAHDIGDGQVDLVRLAARARFELVLDHCIGLDPENRRCLLARGEQLEFRFAAIDTGGVARPIVNHGADGQVISVRPMHDFVMALEQWRKDHHAGGRHIVVIGGGAGGVELAFACANMAGLAKRSTVTLVTGTDGLLPGFAPRLRQLAQRALLRQGITLHLEDARFERGRLMAGRQLLDAAHLVLVAAGSAAPDWPGASGLACDADGFIMVDRFQRSLSHPHILAAGDVAARADRHVARSGVHAVHTGPVLAGNLRSLLAGEAPHHCYTPRPASLYLLSCGDGTALASYGSLAGHGRWAWWLKRWIDRRWIAAYATMAGA